MWCEDTSLSTRFLTFRWTVLLIMGRFVEFLMARLLKKVSAPVIILRVVDCTVSSVFEPMSDKLAAQDARNPNFSGRIAVVVINFRRSSSRDSNTLDMLFNSEVDRWSQGDLISYPVFGIMTIVADFHGCGKYSRRMRPLNICVSWAMTFLPLCLTALMVMPSSPRAFFTVACKSCSDGERKIDLTRWSRSWFSRFSWTSSSTGFGMSQGGVLNCSPIIEAKISSLVSAL